MSGTQWWYSLEVNHISIWGLLSNLVGCESFLELNTTDILALCETDYSLTDWDGLGGNLIDVP